MEEKKSKVTYNSLTKSITTGIVSFATGLYYGVTDINAAAVMPKPDIESKINDESQNVQDDIKPVNLSDCYCIFKKLCYNNIIDRNMEVDVMARKTDFIEYVSPVTPLITVRVSSQKEFEKMFPPVKIDYIDEYIDELEEVFASPFKKKV